ncbi:MAG: hypothetical protein WAJ85_10825 [Candidatus Baltobacteraceae bacterium]|jgi:hypothetical protein
MQTAVFGPAFAADQGASTDPRILALMRSSRCVAQAPADQPSPAATAAASASPGPLASGAALSPPGPPSPTASPTLIPIQPVPPNPGILIPPTPSSTGTPPPSPPPLPTPSARPSAAPIFITRPNATSSSAPGRAPRPAATLGPYQIVTVADRITGYSDTRQPSDLDGNVHVFYEEGQIVGDHAHYDGNHTILLSGHTYLVNRNEDSILYADSISFDTLSRHATLENGRGESVEGVQQGKLHYSAEQLTARSDGVTHGDRASFTTCENPHGGYHIESRTLDIFPGDRLIARKAVIFLGPLAIFYLPLLVIPLRNVPDLRRTSSFLPVIGYDQVEGFYIKTRIGFAPSAHYYGYYRLEYFSKNGLGLGYVAFIGTKNNRRQITIDSYTIDGRSQGGRQTNINIQETENFSSRVRGQFGATYQGDFGPNINLPASLNVTGSIVHQGNASSENLTFSRFLQGQLSDNLNLGFVDTIALSKTLQEQLNVTYSKFNSQLSSSDTLHLTSTTHLTTRLADYSLNYDKTDYSSNPFGYDKIPELQILPHFNYGRFAFPPQLQLTMGQYSEPQNHFNTGRVQLDLNEPIYMKVLGNSDFSANYHITQDYYATGDAKAFDQQNAALSTPLGQHIVNSITYNEQHPIGPANVPFQLLDNLSSGSHGLQDVMRFFNRDVYSLSLSTGTNFNESAQPISYQLTLKPSVRSYLVLGGFWTPGPGNGFATSNVQVITPFGRDTSLQFTTNVDWKNKARLEDKNVYLSKVIGNCYDLQFTYNQDLKQFNFNVVILAFPGQGAGFGFGGGQASPIIPQNFAF